jgi:hypothetical protein
MMSAEPKHPDLQPADERTALAQRLDHYRAILSASLADLTWEEASKPHLPATDLTIAGIVRHLAWAEDRWFQGRLLGASMPSPWSTPEADDPDHSMRLTRGDTVERIVQLYSAACARSRTALQRCKTLDTVAAIPSFGKGRKRSMDHGSHDRRDRTPRGARGSAPRRLESELRSELAPGTFGNCHVPPTLTDGPRACGDPSQGRGLSLRHSGTLRAVSRSAG